MSEKNSGDSLLAFLLGGVAGAALGLLLAPCSGNETRRRVASWIEEEREKAREFIDKEREALLNKKDQVNAAWEAGKKAYRDTSDSNES